MELTLNLVWLCVAITGIGLLWTSLSRKTRSSDGSASTRQKIVAMGCALVILFFVISMTDDLHHVQVLVEEKKGSRIAAVMGARAHFATTHSLPFDFLLVFLPASFSPNLPIVRRGIDPPKFLFAAAVDHENLCSRAPPLSFS